MKKLIPVLLLLFSLNSFSQTYYPFPDSVGVWREMAFWGDIPANPPMVCAPYVYFINGDTIIDSNTYAKLYTFNCPSVVTWMWPPAPCYTYYAVDTLNASYFGALREVNKKVYFRPDTNYNYSFCPDVGPGPYTKYLQSRFITI